MRVEGVGYVQVVGDEGAEDLFAVGFGARGGRRGYGGYVGAADVIELIIYDIGSSSERKPH